MGKEGGWVSDPSYLIDEEAMGKVDALIKELNAAWRMEVAVVVVDSLPAEIRPSAFAAALLNYWGVGDPKLHTGVVALLMIKQRRLEVRVGFGTQRVLKQEFLQKLQQERMVPHLKSGAFGPAFEEFVRGVQEELERDGPKHWRRVTDRGLDKPNQHGFGGGQTPMDEFKAKEGEPEPTGTLSGGPAGAAPS